MLEESGLVRQEKNRGVFVRDIPLEEALEIYDLRAAMDELVGRRLAETITLEQLKSARAIVERMDVAARAGDSDAYHLLNLEFHDALVGFTGNRKLAGVYRKLVKELALFRRRNLRDQQLLPHSAAEHRGILKAIASGDPEQAGRAMFDHVMESRERARKGEGVPQPLRARAGRKG
jgi:DNA-binding GntR family transcriptional regulator